MSESPGAGKYVIMNYEAFFGVFSLVFFRALGLIVFLPFEIMPAGFGIRMLLSLLLAMAGVKYYLPTESFTLLSYATEFFLGFASVLPLILLLQSTEFFGDLLEAMRGQTLATIFSPMVSAENSILPEMLKGLLWVLLIQSGVLEIIFSNFIYGLKISAGAPDYWERNLYLFCRLFSSAIGMTLPFAFVTLGIELVMMLFSKLIPGISPESYGFLLRLILTGLGILILIQSDIILSVQKFILISISGGA